jgi:hypothetical protein
MPFETPPPQVASLRIEILNLLSGEQANIHIRAEDFTVSDDIPFMNSGSPPHPASWLGEVASGCCAKVGNLFRREKLERI